MEQEVKKQEDKGKKIIYKIIYYIVLVVLFFYAIRFLSVTGFFPLYGSLFLPYQKNTDIGDLKLTPKQQEKILVNIQPLTSVTKNKILHLLVKLLYMMASSLVALGSGLIQIILSPIRISIGIYKNIFHFLGKYIGFFNNWASGLKKIHESEFLLFGFHQQIYNYIYQQIGKTGWKYTGLELLFLGIFICILITFYHLFAGNLQQIIIYSCILYVIYVFAPDKIYKMKLNNPTLTEMIGFERNIK